MSKRLQVLLPDQEMAEIRRLARREHLTLEAWVRKALREARERNPLRDAESKLKAVRRAAQHSFPTANIGKMLHEIESGRSCPDA